MATRSWLDELAQEAEDGSARLQEMLSVGLGFCAPSWASTWGWSRSGTRAG